MSCASLSHTFDTACCDGCLRVQGHDVEKFLVSGASKRGWTTWLVGGVLGNQPDSRVVGIAPIVMDMLDFQPNVLHMYKAYGACSSWLLQR